ELCLAALGGMVPSRAAFFSAHEKSPPWMARDKEVRMLRGIAKLVAGVVLVGVGILGALAATGLAGDGFGGAMKEQENRDGEGVGEWWRWGGSQGEMRLKKQKRKEGPGVRSRMPGPFRVPGKGQ